MPDAQLADNPLLVTDGLPRFDRIEPAHVVPAVRKVLADAAARFDAIERSVQPTWSSAVEALDELFIPFQYAWSPVSHLLGVLNSPELRKAHEEVLARGRFVQPAGGAKRAGLPGAQGVERGGRLGIALGSAAADREPEDPRCRAVGHRPGRREAGAVQRDRAGTVAVGDRFLQPRARRDQGVFDRPHRAGRRRGAASQPAAARLAVVQQHAGGREDARDGRGGSLAVHAGIPELRSLLAAQPPPRSARKDVSREPHAGLVGIARQYAVDPEDPLAAG